MHASGRCRPSLFCLLATFCLLALAAVSPAVAQAPPSAPLYLDGPLTTRTVAGPAWAKNAPIYEVNLDVYHFPKGTALREFEKHLPVLKEMGIGLVWLMPLHPRGEKKAFGSPYCVRDYTAINPDFGTKADFKHLVDHAHRLGLHVLMDWVPNHTSWDNALITSHPDFYAKNDRGEIVQANTWSDVAQLDYGTRVRWNQPLWDTMRGDMVYWVREFGIDGFRCDVAGRGGKVPVEFWRWLRPQLDAVRPVFLLAEADDAYLHPAFDMSYGWNLPPVLWDVCAGRKPASAIDDVLRQDAQAFPPGAIRMHFIDNHDWHPHADWMWGDKPAITAVEGMPQVAPLMVLCATLPGKPLLYNGQEMGFAKTDPPRDGKARVTSPVWAFYRRLLGLYRERPALISGDFTRIATDHDTEVYAFRRQQGRDQALILVNLSGAAQTVTLRGDALAGTYRDGFTNRTMTLAGAPTATLEPWGYRVYVRQMAARSASVLVTPRRAAATRR